MNILLIDDETVCGELARESIRHEFDNVTVEQQLDCVSGLRALEEKDFDALILDLNLKCCDLDGYECLKHARQIWPNMPIVILTGAWSEERREECLNAGADYYVIKGSVNQVLGLGIRTAIEKRKASLAGDCWATERRKKLCDLRERLKLGTRLDGIHS